MLVLVLVLVRFSLSSSPSQLEGVTPQSGKPRFGRSLTPPELRRSKRKAGTLRLRPLTLTLLKKK